MPHFLPDWRFGAFFTILSIVQACIFAKKVGGNLSADLFYLKN